MRHLQSDCVAKNFATKETTRSDTQDFK